MTPLVATNRAASEVASQRPLGPLTVTVGIPAYNEEANIGRLLYQVLQQRRTGFRLERVIVVSDGSTDGTCSAVEEVCAQDARVTLIAGVERLGRSARQLQFMHLCTSDVLVSLDGDVLLPDRHLLVRLVAPIGAGADLVSGGLTAAPAHSLFEKTLASGLRLRNRISAAYRSGDNVYTCHGPARAFSRKAYQSYPCGDGIGEDAFSYFWVKESGAVYHFAEDANVEIKLPGTFRDHWLQSARFQQNQSELRQHFSQSTIRSGYRLPPLLCLHGLLQEVLESPAYALGYLGILALTILTTPKTPSRNATWPIATSTKQVHG